MPMYLSTAISPTPCWICPAAACAILSNCSEVAELAFDISWANSFSNSADFGAGLGLAVGLIAFEVVGVVVVVTGFCSGTEGACSFLAGSC